MTNRYERIRKARKALEGLRERFAREAAHPAITHCEECGCDWLDNGLNPVGCPYCKQSADAKILVAERDALTAEIEALRAEVERVTCELMDAITRADKLAEALRELVDVFRESGMYDDEVFAKALDALEQENNSRGTSP